MPVAGDLVDPCRHLRALRIELRGLVPGGQHHILHNVFGLGGGHATAHEKPLQAGREMVVKLRKCATVTRIAHGQHPCSLG